MDWGLGSPNKTAALIAMLMVAVWGLAFIRFRAWPRAGGGFSGSRFNGSRFNGSRVGSLPRFTWRKRVPRLLLRGQVVLLFQPLNPEPLNREPELLQKK